MAFRLAAISLRQILRLILLACRSSRSEDIEILVLRQEVEILRRQNPRPRIRPEERLVLTVVHWLRPARDRLSLLVTPDMLRRWHRELVRRKWHFRHGVSPRRAIPLENQLVVWRTAKENPTWGYRPIQGELLKVGIEISATSIRRNLAVEHGRPGPKRDTWCQFLRAQASSIVAYDLFTVETIRLKTLHVLFFIDLHTRRVLIGGVTDGAASVGWCAQIARNLSETGEERAEPIEFLIHDRDYRFGPIFDEVFTAEGVKTIRTPWRAAKANAYAERWIRTVRSECLDRLMILNRRHLETVLRTYIEHYNRERPHRGLNLRTPEGGPHVKPVNASAIARRDPLGGLIHEYHRKAA